jgi:hypothetical protein
LQGLRLTEDLVSTEPSAEARRGFGFTLGLLVVVAMILAATYLPEGLVGPAVHARQEVATLLWPMRWGFYTDAAEAEFTVAYRVRGGDLEPLIAPNVERQWGLSRSGYGDVVRLVSTALRIPADAWHDCAADDIRGCAPVLATMPAVQVASTLPQACASVVFAVEQPSAGPSRRIRRVAAVDLAC